VIFVHGCFWHGHNCARGARIPSTNRAYWKTKIERNATRDAKHIASLPSLGWQPLVVWECELHDPNLRSRLQSFLR
jgi:DNA mismatch endonuclease (patch repair protein)